MLPPYYSIEIIDPLGQTVDSIENPVALEAARSFGAVGSATLTILPVFNEDFFRYNMRFKLWRYGSDHVPSLFGDTIWFLRKFRHNVTEGLYIVEMADALALLNNPVVAYTSQTPYADKTLEENEAVVYSDLFRIDNMMRAYVSENFSVNALDGTRINPFIIVEQDLNLAPYGEKEASWQKLDSVLSDLARMSAEKGMDLFYDLFPQADGRFLFRVWKERRGVDRGFSSAESMVFTDKNNDLDEIEVLYDYGEMGTYCYVLGYDTGPSQIIAEVGDPAIIRSDPFGRIEFTQSESESDVRSVLLASGEAALRGRRPKRMVSAKLSAASSVKYGTDFAYGDKVGVEINGKQYDCQISAVRMSWAEGEETLDIRLDGSEGLYNPAAWEGDTPTPINVPSASATPPPTVPPDFGLFGGQELVAAVASEHVYRTFDFQTPAGSGGPTWTEHLDFSVDEDMEEDSVQTWVVDPFSPGYINGTGAINGFIVTRAHIYRVTDIFGTIAAEVIYSFALKTGTNAAQYRTIQASFGRYFPSESDNPWIMCVSNYHNAAGHTGIWAVYSLDAGQTWSDEILISSGYATTFASPTLHTRPIGIYLSPRTPGLAFTSAYDSTTDFPNVSARVSTDWGETWSTLTTPNIEFAGDPQLPSHMIHVPWPGNEDELSVYYAQTFFGRNSIPTYMRYRLLRVEDDGETVTDISPNDGTRSYGPLYTPFGVRTHDSNRDFVIMAGTGNDVSNDIRDDYYGVWVSDDRGDSWTNIVTPAVTGEFYIDIGFEAAFGGDSPDVIFIWGGDINVSGRLVIGYSDDFGDNVDNRSGNMHSSFDSGDSGFNRFVGIAGGPPTP